MYSFSSCWSVLQMHILLITFRLFLQRGRMPCLVKALHIDIEIYSTVNDFTQFNDVRLYLR